MRKPTWKGLLLTYAMLSPIVVLVVIIGVGIYVMIKVEGC